SNDLAFGAEDVICGHDSTKALAIDELSRTRVVRDAPGLGIVISPFFDHFVAKYDLHRLHSLDGHYTAGPMGKLIDSPLWIHANAELLGRKVGTWPFPG